MLIRIAAVYFATFCVCAANRYPLYIHKTITGLCDFQGYRVGKTQKYVSRITAPMVKLEDDVINEIAGLTSHSTDVSNNALGFITTFTKKFADHAPGLAATLGVFSSVFGAFTGLTDPTPAEIISSANNALKQLTNEINDRFQVLKDYVDLADIKTSFDSKVNDFKSIFQKWSNCLYKRVSESKKCQREVADKIFTEYHQFLIDIDEMPTWGGFKYQKLNNKVRRIEVYFILFRDFTNLGIKVLQTVVNEYKKDFSVEGTGYYNEYRKKLEKFGKQSIKYAKDAYHWIKTFHITYGSGKCKQTLWTGKTTYEEKGSLFSRYKDSSSTKSSCWVDTAVKPEKWCHVIVQFYIGRFSRFSRRKIPYKYKYILSPSYKHQEAAKYFGQKELEEKAKRYYTLYKNAIENYWQNQVLDLIPTWQKVVNRSKYSFRKKPGTIGPCRYC